MVWTLYFLLLCWLYWFPRNLCAIDWMRKNPGGLKLDFEGYYKNLTNDQTQVSSYFEISLQCALLTVVACTVLEGWGSQGQICHCECYWYRVSHSLILYLYIRKRRLQIAGLRASLLGVMLNLVVNRSESRWTGWYRKGWPRRCDYIIIFINIFQYIRVNNNRVQYALIISQYIAIAYNIPEILD